MDAAIVHRDHIILIDDLAAVLVREVLAPPGDPFVPPGNDLPPFRAWRGALLCRAEVALGFCPRLFL